MKKFIETIRMEDGELIDAPSHWERMVATQREYYGGGLDLHPAFPKNVEIEESLCHGVVKYRILYGKEVESVTLARYTPRVISTLRMVEAPDDIDYHRKFQDRSALDALYAQRGDCDEVIIVHRGFITETTFSSLLMHTCDEWLVPRHALLPGTMRMGLLYTGRAHSVVMTPDDLLPGNKYGITHLSLINAMLPPERAPHIPLENIKFLH